MSRPLYYCASRVAVGDRVEILFQASAYRGEVIAMDDTRREVIVAYDDWQDVAPDGASKRKFRSIPIEDVRLIARAV